MGKMINDIMNELDVRPGMADWEFAVRRYAMDLFKECMEQNGLNQWDEASRLGTITEKDLLNGAKDWDQYSRSSSLIYSMDIRMRLHIDDQEDLFDIQTKALEEAAYLVVAMISRLTGHGYHEFHETEELKKHLNTGQTPVGICITVGNMIWKAFQICLKNCRGLSQNSGKQDMDATSTWRNMTGSITSP